jgi:hypothetical protein
VKLFHPVQHPPKREWLAEQGCGFCGIGKPIIGLKLGHLSDRSLMNAHNAQKACDPFKAKKTCQTGIDKSYLNVERSIIERTNCKEQTSPPRAYRLLSGTDHCEIIIKDPDYTGPLPARSPTMVSPNPTPQIPIPAVKMPNQ